MALFTVDTDGVSGSYSSLTAALGALPDPFTEDNTITLDASTAVKDTTNASGIIIDTTTNYRLYIIGSDDYIYSPANGDFLGFDHSFANFYHITIDGVNFEKPSQTASWQRCLDFLNMRDGDIIVKNSQFIGDSGITNVERLVNLEAHTAGNVTYSFINNVFKIQGSSTHSTTACVSHTVDRPVYMYNNTFSGYRANNTNAVNALYINNIINTTVAGFTVSTSSDYNMFSGAFDFGGTNDEQSQTFTFVDAGNDDYHLQSSDTGARGKGTDLSADGNFPFDYDKDGNTRSAWDAGAYEFVSSAGGFTLTADAGTFSIIGQSAGLTINRNVSAESGNLTISGQNASLTTNRVMISETGTMSITGQDANLLYGAGFILNAEAGSLAITGQDASLIHGQGFTLSAETGSFSIAGQDAGLNRDYVVNAETGVLTITGPDAILIYSGESKEYYKEIQTKADITTILNSNGDVISILSTKSDTITELTTKGEIA